MAERTTFYMGYDGEAIQSGTMDVKDLAPALLAMGELLQETNRFLNSRDCQLQVRVKADFKTGSFEINLEIIQSITEQISSFFFGNNYSPPEKIIFLLGFISGTKISCSLIKFLNQLRGRKVKSATPADSKNINIEISGDNNIIMVPNEVWRLAQNPPTREKLEKVMQPLENEGIDTFFTGDSSTERTIVTKAELPYLKQPPFVDIPVLNSEQRIALAIDSLSFQEGLVWKFHDGGSKLNARIADPDFVQSIDKGIEFRKGDILVVDMATRQIQTKSGLKNEHTIVKVLEHRKAYRQLDLFEDNPQ